MNEFAVPEILRSPLDAILLLIYANPKLPRLSAFDFLQQPDARIIYKSIQRLATVGALEMNEGSGTLLASFHEEDGGGILSTYKEKSSLTLGTSTLNDQELLIQMDMLNITPLGRILATLPVEVIIGKMLILAMVIMYF